MFGGWRSILRVVSKVIPLAAGGLKYLWPAMTSPASIFLTGPVSPVFCALFFLSALRARLSTFSLSIIFASLSQCPNCKSFRLVTRVISTGLGFVNGTRFLRRFWKRETKAYSSKTRAVLTATPDQILLAFYQSKGNTFGSFGRLISVMQTIQGNQSKA